MLTDRVKNPEFKPKIPLIPMAAPKLQALWNHPAGPKTIFFWAPTFKWGITIANVADFSKPSQEISYPQQFAIACTGLIFSRYSTVINPKNLNLFGNSIAMSSTAVYQITRKIKDDCFSEEEVAVINQ
ncbi:mitochondrial pyruvate carrier 4-like [Tripterygium wilfordii]|uniref:mitochondrial pyruvate carrier 4-like n=1 Tax=Tripterygium wilfordii TaxID=458696 RepID=UPI0018F8605E|nr:mitochondrial pyruvate carrier 4-like [Tripterygium wilfordii]